jgi:hypothetical protein
VVELQEDAVEPNLVVTLDGRSRYQLIQLTLVNHGQSPAFSAKIVWQTGPTLRNGTVVQLGPNGILPKLHKDPDAV